MPNLTLLEIFILQAGALILAFTIYFVFANKRALRKAMEASGAGGRMGVLKKESAKTTAGKLVMPKQWMLRTRKAEVAWPQPLAAGADLSSGHSVAVLKESLHQQQQTLSYLLQQVEHLQGDNSGRDAFVRQSTALQQRIEELEVKLLRKDQELKVARQHEALAQEMAARIDDMYSEFELLQRKIISLETQAGRAAALNLELEDMRQSYQQMQKDLARRQQKLEESLSANQRLQSEVNRLEDQLAAAELQRQQLVKRTQMLQDVHSDLLAVPESQSSLEQEMRRISELQSMLKMMGSESSKRYQGRK